MSLAQFNPEMGETVCTELNNNLRNVPSCVINVIALEMQQILWPIKKTVNLHSQFLVSKRKLLVILE